MCGELFVAGVGVVVILRQKVNIMQEDATPVFISEGLPHANIKQLGSVKGAIPPLKPEREAQAKGNTYTHYNEAPVCFCWKYHFYIEGSVCKSKLCHINCLNIWYYNDQIKYTISG